MKLEKFNSPFKVKIDFKKWWLVYPLILWSHRLSITLSLANIIIHYCLLNALGMKNMWYKWNQLLTLPHISNWEKRILFVLSCFVYISWLCFVLFFDKLICCNIIMITQVTNIYKTQCIKSTLIKLTHQWPKKHRYKHSEAKKSRYDFI